MRAHRVGTMSNIPTLPIGQYTYVRSYDGRLLAQGQVLKAGQQPQLLLDVAPGQWSCQQEHMQSVERKRPGYAIVLGVAGFILWPLLLFWFVKTDITTSGYGVKINTPQGFVVGRYPNQ